ncbi:uncharacterized protein [Halyomorpha halys]|uniref:uncharacterized protein n=1 Tax=Halyomorpha halys TaxID=286706 RepID=UPI0006D506F4|nr:uncharacterized protein LOC106678488 [Halyomorpha halys]
MNPFGEIRNSNLTFTGGIFSKNVSPVAPGISQITTHYQQQISKDIEDLTKLIVESAHSSTANPFQKLPNHEFEKYKAIAKIQNSVLFMTNLIHKSEWNGLSDV